MVYYYGYRYVPVANWVSLIPVLSLLVHGVLFFYAIMNIRKKDPVAFGILFYLINMGAYCNLFKPAPGIMAERFTLSASIGFAITFCFILFRLLKLEPLKFSWNTDSKKAGYILCAVAALFSIKSISRNPDWKNKLTLYTHDMPYLTESSKGNMMYANAMLGLFHENTNHAVQFSRIGNRDSVNYYMSSANRYLTEAQEHFKRATEITPTYSIAWVNLGSTYYFQKNYAPALQYSFEGLKLLPDSKEGLYNVAMTYNALQKTDSAEMYFKRVMEIDSDDVNVHDQIAKIAFAKGDTATAIQYYLKCLGLNPNSEMANVNAAQFYLKINNRPEAIRLTEKAAELNPENIGRLQNLATYYQQNGNAAKASYYFEKINQARTKK
jgi:tetratricopeptide (TPR) repeat protein